VGGGGELMFVVDGERGGGGKEGIGGGEAIGVELALLTYHFGCCDVMSYECCFWVVDGLDWRSRKKAL
jgi:hypothetical protein